ncbi:MAG: SDR family oxidoreductase [Candidatus Acidiferrales bacterium]
MASRSRDRRSDSSGFGTGPGDAEDVAKAVLFLASDDSPYINAIELMVDGGVTGAPFGAPILRV